MKLRNVLLSAVIAITMAGCYTVAVESMPEPVPYMYYYPYSHWHAGVWYTPGWYGHYVWGGYRHVYRYHATPRSQSHGSQPQGHRR